MASLLLVVAVSAVVLLFDTDPDHRDPSAVVWISLLRTLDPGTMGGDTGNAIFLAMMLVVTIGGIFIVSSLVGILASGLNTKLAELRKGRSQVVEHGHTVILGWSEQIFTIIGELELASEGERVCVAILADRDKVEMEDEIRARLPRRSRVRVVCRTGSPTRPADLDIVRPDQAAVIVIPSRQDEDPDVRLIKTLLSLSHRPWPDGRPPVVAVVTDSTNMPAATLAGGPAAKLIDAQDLAARLVVQSRRQPGLSLVYNELLTFAGDEIYMRSEPSLSGRPFAAALFAYDTAAVIGLKHPDGQVVLNPPSDTVIVDGDEIILLAQSPSMVRLAAEPASIVADAIAAPERAAPVVERTLMLGWNERGPTILTLLDRYLPAGSALTIASYGRPPGEMPAAANLRITTTSCDPTRRPALQALDLQQFQYVIVLAEDHVGVAHADSRTLVTLLHLRDLKDKQAGSYAMVSELIDDENRQLAQVTNADDFVVGSKLISLLLTQLSKNQYLQEVFAELFDAQGSDMYVEPAGNYLIAGAKANFATVIEAARRRGETAVGYRVQSHAKKPPAYGIVLNPDKTEPLSLHPGDQVVVLAKTAEPA
ncbi:CASTOR/POLLUX-related putative ion channel [Rhizocola hellebori]|uniref:CASTOR/POLLUX-related putative ion channel n=1 Tax=Rhizocola hellebori TaxID=1392758 RepID=UPI001945565A|nr:hypothetical protein [Rhizocola hellebori]